MESYSFLSEFDRNAIQGGKILLWDFVEPTDETGLQVEADEPFPGLKRSEIVDLSIRELNMKVRELGLDKARVSALRRRLKNRCVFFFF